MGNDELSLDDIEGILSSPEPTRSSRTKKDPTEPRDIMTWLHIQHESSFDCTVPNHEAVTDRPRSKGMTTPIGDIHVCRICFLEGADKVE